MKLENLEVIISELRKAIVRELDELSITYEIKTVQVEIELDGFVITIGLKVVLDGIEDWNLWQLTSPGVLPYFQNSEYLQIEVKNA